MIDIVVADPNDNISDVVAVTLAQFIEQEEEESQAVVDTLYSEYKNFIRKLTTHLTLIQNCAILYQNIDKILAD